MEILAINVSAYIHIHVLIALGHITGPFSVSGFTYAYKFHRETEFKHLNIG